MIRPKVTFRKAVSLIDSSPLKPFHGTIERSARLITQLLCLLILWETSAIELQSIASGDETTTQQNATQPSQASLLSKPQFIHNGVTAHRGNSGEFPENTLPAFESGIAVGADWIELDLFKTADGKLVVIHDTSTKRTGLIDLPITGTSLLKLQTVDVASEFRQRRALSLKACPPAQVPLLEDVLGMVIQQNRTRVSIQPKMDCVGEAIELISEMNAIAWVGFNDGNLMLMKKVKQLSPSIPVFWDRGASTKIAEDVKQATSHGFDALVFNASGITKQKIELAKAANLQVGAWTVNDPKEMKQLLDMGVERIYTDFPSRLLEILKQDDHSPLSKSTDGS
ncbi:glycerophosphodiester phosphodiesterase [bacterium]|nr:glycerophosphodiester phosphodiesterase [bacterium]